MKTSVDAAAARWYAGVPVGGEERWGVDMEQARQDAEGVVPVTAGGTAKGGRDRVIRLAFVIVTLVVVGFLFWLQRRGLSLPGWGSDLPAALARAAAEGRSVVVFFASSPPGETGSMA